MNESLVAESSDELEIAEPDCDRVSIEQMDQTGEIAEPAVDADAEGVTTACSFLAAGGDWGGSHNPVNRAIAIARANQLTVTSQKRDWGSSGSDHHKSQRTSYAADLSNGSAPTPQMDRTAAQIAARLGHPGWRGGYLTVRCGRVRGQLIWRAPDHFNHVHFGVRVG